MDEIKFCLPDVHIGKSLEDWMNSHRISQLKLSKMLDIPQSSLSRMFKSKTINTLKLTQISLALKHNFFKQFCGKMETTNRGEFYMPILDIGKVIDDYMHSHKVSRKDLAEKLGVDPSGITKIINKDSIDTGKLLDISYALEYNFFECFCMSEMELSMNQLFGGMPKIGETDPDSKPGVMDMILNRPIYVPLKEHPDTDYYVKELLEINELLLKENRELKHENAYLKSEIQKMKK